MADSFRNIMTNTNQVTQITPPVPILAESLSLVLQPKASPEGLAQDINSSLDDVGAVLYVLDDNKTITHITNKFYLTAMAVSLKERVQLLETFSASNLSFFNESISVYSFNGMAVEGMNTNEGDKFSYFQLSSLVDLYNNVLRGTQLVEKKSIAVLKVSNNIIYGYPIAFNFSHDSNLANAAQFSMSWVVVEHTLTGIPGMTSLDTAGAQYADSVMKSIKANLKTLADYSDRAEEWWTLEARSITKKQVMGAINALLSYKKAMLDNLVKDYVNGDYFNEPDDFEKIKLLFEAAGVMLNSLINSVKFISGEQSA